MIYWHGKIPKVDNTDIENPVVTWLDGYHCNSIEQLQGLDAHLVTPEIPYMVAAGVESFFYKFTDEVEFYALTNFNQDEQVN
jgi:hypothetical protein